MKEINKIVYQASDGKLFETKEECLEYEKTIEIVLLDASFNVLEIDEDGIKNNSYVYIGNKKSLKFIQDKGHYLGISVPKGVGYWYWKDDEGEFESLTEEIDFLTEKLNNLSIAQEIMVDKSVNKSIGW